MSKYPVVFVAALAAIGLGLAGCHKSENPPVNQNSPSQQMKQGAQQLGQGAKAYGKKIGQAASDTAITTKVKSKLAANQGLSSFNIHVETNNGVVTLTGTVDMVSKRDLAERIATGTDGVKSVVNDIVIAPNASTAG